MTYAPWYGGIAAAVSLLVIYALSTTSKLDRLSRKRQRFVVIWEIP
jgi:hypothetical protein